MSDEDRRVLVKNIPYDISEKELFNWCSSFGAVQQCALKLDKFRQSRGFAFVTFADMAGVNSILSQGPHSCHGRSLLVKLANEPKSPLGHTSYSSSEHRSQTTSYLSTADNSSGLDDDSSNRLGALQDELDANLECMQIAHEHEVKLLREKLAKEQKLCQQAAEAFKEAEDDLAKARAENVRLRESLIKNVMQTFNIRRDLARQTKEQLRQCTQLEQQCQELRQPST